MRVVIPLELGTLPDRRRSSLILLLQGPGCRMNRVADPVTLPAPRVLSAGLTTGSISRNSHFVAIPMSQSVGVVIPLELGTLRDRRRSCSNQVTLPVSRVSSAGLFTASHEAQGPRALFEDPAAQARRVHDALAARCRQGGIRGLCA